MTSLTGGDTQGPLQAPPLGPCMITLEGLVARVRVCDCMYSVKKQHLKNLTED